MKMAEDPIPNELDNALSQLIPAVMACGDPQSPDYLDLAVFETLVETAPTWRGSAAGGGGRGRLSVRVAGQVEVAFRHCMHETAMAVTVRDEGGGGGGGGRAMRTRGKKGKSSRSGGGGGSGDLFSEMGAPVGVLSLALDFVSNEVAVASASGSGKIEEALTRLPMVLVEDFLESQGREACTQFWSKWVEPNAARLTAAPLVLGGGKYTLIRLCKKLAQRMSKTHDSSFCGQIHLFLSKALTFFERSGLNVTGGLNLDNVTAFEDEEQFRRAMLGFDVEDEAGAASAGEAAAVATAGKGAGGGESGGDAMDVDAGAGGGGKGEGDDEGEFAVDYRLYQAFWRLQKYALSQDAAVKGAGAKDTWNAILADVDKILDAFEANAFSDHDLRLARERWMGGGGSGGGGGGGGAAANGSSSSSKRRRMSDVMELEANGAAAGEGGGYFGLKYLTSSRLLRLQLRDPTLRLQVLTQWLILAASLKSKVGKDKDSPNSAADLNLRMERAKRLVKATPPRGEEYLNMLQTVLHRESAWTQWKDVDKCKDIPSVPVGEAKAAAAAAAAGIVAAAPSYPNKRPRPQASVALAERAKHAPLGADFPLEKMVSKLHAGVPNSTDYLEDQRMCAEDPDIPSSELPSAGPLYTWRALRLLGRENPANLAGCYDGDLVAAMDRLDKAKNAIDAAAAAEAAEAAAASESAAAAAVEKATGAKTQPPSAVSGIVGDAAVAVAMAVDDEGEAGEEDGEEGEVELTGSPGGAESSESEGAGGCDANGSAAGEGSGDGGRGDEKAGVAPMSVTAGASPSSPRAAAAAAAAAADDDDATPDNSNPGSITIDVPDSAATGLPEEVAAADDDAAAAQTSPTVGEGGGRRKAGKVTTESPSAAAATEAAAAATAKAAASPRSPRVTRRRSKME